MIGLSPQQLIEITEFVQKHHKFAYVREEDRIDGHYGYCIKYIDACYDSRQGDYWSITFRGGIDISFSTNAFNPLFNEKPKGFSYTTLYDWIMDFLMYKWEPKGNEYKFLNCNEHPRENFPIELSKEWTDMDMINSYCGDLEDGTNTQDIADACKWVLDYRQKLNKGFHGIK